MPASSCRASTNTARRLTERYGGTVEKFIGDAVMAVWGTPVAREDDAERAVRAALDLMPAVAALAPGLQVRAGILTGETAVNIGAVGEGMVVGDVVNNRRPAPVRSSSTRSWRSGRTILSWLSRSTRPGRSSPGSVRDRTWRRSTRWRGTAPSAGSLATNRAVSPASTAVPRARMS
jgi:hypothetical protein